MWIYLPISVSSAASADSTLPSDSLLQRLVASAMWRSKFLRLASWRRAWKTAPWMRRLSGVTLEPYQQNSIVAEWLEQFSVSPARICLSQESKRALKVGPEADFSTLPCASFARLDANGAFLKMSLHSSLFPQDIPYSENLPKAGSMRSGFLFERPTLALRTDESASSSWPTARAEDSECCGNHQGAQDSLGGATRNWGTPRANDAEKRGVISGDPRNGVLGQAVNWGTPNTRDAHPHGPRLSAKQRQLTLVDQAERGLSE